MLTKMHAWPCEQMGFVAMHDKVLGVVGVAVSNNRKYLACIEEAEDAESHQVTVYSIQTLKRVKTLVTDPNLVQSGVIVSIHFRQGQRMGCVGGCAMVDIQGGLELDMICSHA